MHVWSRSWCRWRRSRRRCLVNRWSWGVDWLSGRYWRPFWVGWRRRWWGVHDIKLMRDVVERMIEKMAGVWISLKRYSFSALGSLIWFFSGLSAELGNIGESVLLYTIRWGEETFHEDSDECGVSVVGSWRGCASCTTNWSDLPQAVCDWAIHKRGILKHRWCRRCQDQQRCTNFQVIAAHPVQFGWCN